MIAVAILISSIVILILLERTVITGLIFKFSQSILARNVEFAKYWLFINGMISSFAPVPTELSITAALLSGINQAQVMVILDAGSVIGAILAYCVGFKGAYYIGRISSRSVRIDEAFVRLWNFLQKYMWLVILISPWIPIVGEYSSIAAGVQKYKFGVYILLTITGKTVKIISLVLLISWILHLIHQLTH